MRHMTPEEKAERDDYLMNEQQNTQPPLAQAPGPDLLRRLKLHRAIMAPHQKERCAGKLLLEAADEIERLIGICTHVRDRMLRGDDDMTLMAKLAEGCRGPNARTEPPPTGDSGK